MNGNVQRKHLRFIYWSPLTPETISRNIRHTYIKNKRIQTILERIMLRKCRISFRNYLPVQYQFAQGPTSSKVSPSSPAPPLIPKQFVSSYPSHFNSVPPRLCRRSPHLWQIVPTSKSALLLLYVAICYKIWETKQNNSEKKCIHV